MKTAIELKNINKFFDLIREKHTSLKATVLSFKRQPIQKLHVLKDISISIKHGETVAIIGRNGSGKSTTLGIIGKIYKPTSGTVEIDGRMCTMLALGSGFHPDLTGRENIFFNGAVMGLTTSQVKEKLDRIIDFSELDDFIDTPIKTYSDGMKMRLGFAIATETDPEILLIDEVLAVGDTAFQDKCYKRIEQFKNAGRTIVFVTHDLEAAKSVASRTIWLNNGEILADGNTQSVVDSYLATVPTHE